MHALPTVNPSIQSITQTAPPSPPPVKQAQASKEASPSSVVTLGKTPAPQPQLVYSADTIKAQQATNAAKTQTVSPLLSSKSSEVPTQ